MAIAGQNCATAVWKAIVILGPGSGRPGSGRPGSGRPDPGPRIPDPGWPIHPARPSRPATVQMRDRKRRSHVTSAKTRIYVRRHAPPRFPRKRDRRRTWALRLRRFRSSS